MTKQIFWPIGIKTKAYWISHSIIFGLLRNQNFSHQFKKFYWGIPLPNHLTRLQPDSWKGLLIYQDRTYMVISSLYSTLQVQSTFIYTYADYQHSQHHFLKWEDRSCLSTSAIPRWHSGRSESFWLPVQYYPWHYLSLHFIYSIKITGDWCICFRFTWCPY